MRSHCALRCVLLLSFVGCGNHDAAPAPYAKPRGAPHPQLAAEHEPTQPNQVAPAPPAQPPAQAAPVAAAPEKEQLEEAEKKRDYSAELLRAIGTPIDCLKPREDTDSPAEIDVQLEAYFLETGAMSRGYARSSRLDAEELKCLQTKLSSIQLQGPIEAAPRAVQTTLRFKLKTPL